MVATTADVLITFDTDLGAFSYTWDSCRNRLARGWGDRQVVATDADDPKKAERIARDDFRRVCYRVFRLAR